MKIIAPLSALLIALQARAVSVAPGQEALLKDLFDGGAKVSLGQALDFTPGFVVPETVLPKREESQNAPGTLLITAEVAVPASTDVERSRRALENSIEHLRRAYGFIRDLSFEPKPAVDDEPRFTIQPFPAPPRSEVFRVRGFIRSARYQDLVDDKAVRNTAAQAAPGAPDELLAFLDAHAAALVSIRGVETVGIGLDCGVKGEHQHVLPHRPVVLISLAAGSHSGALERHLLHRVPELSTIPYRLEVRAEAAGFSWDLR